MNAQDLVNRFPEFATTLALCDRTGTADIRTRSTRIAPGLWVRFCGFDPRGYGVFLYRLGPSASIRVLAGCRNYTLTAAAKHWGPRRARQCGRTYMQHAKAIRQLIGIGLRGARWASHIPKLTKPMEPFL